MPENDFDYNRIRSRMYDPRDWMLREHMIYRDEIERSLNTQETVRRLRAMFGPYNIDTDTTFEEIALRTAASERVLREELIRTNLIKEDDDDSDYLKDDEF